jgi:hypothetical protein
MSSMTTLLTHCCTFYQAFLNNHPIKISKSWVHLSKNLKSFQYVLFHHLSQFFHFVLNLILSLPAIFSAHQDKVFLESRRNNDLTSFWARTVSVQWKKFFVKIIMGSPLKSNVPVGRSVPKWGHANVLLEAKSRRVVVHVAFWL